MTIYKDTTKYKEKIVLFYTLFVLVSMILQNFTMQKLDIIIVPIRLFITVVVFFLCYNKYNTLTMIFFLSFIVSMIVSYFTHLSALIYMFEIINLLLTIMMFDTMVISKKNIKLIINIFLVFVFSLLIIAPNGFHDHPEKFYKGIIKINPNGTAFLFFLTYCVSMFYYLKTYEKQYAVIGVLSTIVQANYISRTAVIGIIFITLLFFIFRKLNFNKNFFTITTFILLLGGIVFAYLYAVVLHNLIGTESITVFGKQIFTGRQTIWADAFCQLNGYYLFGKGNTLHSIPINHDTSGITNLHNQSMGIMFTFGVISFILYMLVLSKLSYDISKNGQNKYIMSFLFVIFIMSYFDTILYSINSSMIAFVFIIINSINKFEKQTLPIRNDLLMSKKELI